MNAKRTVSIALVVVAAAAGGWLANEWLGPAPRGPAAGEPQVGSGPCPGGAEALYWKAPMDPTYVRNKPGKSPMGMDLVPVCSAEGEAPAAGGVKIDPALVQNMGVRTAVIGRRDLTRMVRTVGRVDYDERLVEQVHTKIQGWIEKLYVEYEGEMVKRGQPLLDIYSPALVSTQEELLIAERYRKSTGDSPFADVKGGGEELFEATRRRLELWDIPDREIDRLLERGVVRKTLTLYAPASGVVASLMVRNGMEVAPNQNLYTIADLSRVWVYADIYEYELPWIAEGQRCTVKLSYLPGVTLEGKVDYIYPYLDPKTRTARVRLEFENPDLILKPDMFANVRIEAESRTNVLAVPEEAVIRSGLRNLVIVSLGDGRFRPQEVTLGLDSGEGWLEVREGLRESDRVVTSGQFLIDSESNLQEAIEKLVAPDSGDNRSHESPAMGSHSSESKE
jgi:multidrug efflux pump subunit AcrA (membrane-fusion protein)